MRTTSPTHGHDAMRRATRVAQHPPVKRDASNGEPAFFDLSQVAGAFSLCTGEPLRVDAVRGLALRVCQGSARIRGDDRRTYLVTTGERFIAEGAGPLTFSAAARSQMRIVAMPLPEDRLSPGLEPVAACECLECEAREHCPFARAASPWN